jgi:hypothetical protein
LFDKYYMNLKELDSFRLSDAVTFHDELNPKLWNNNNLRPEVKLQLKLIARDFLEELGIQGIDVEDLTVSGSNAAYSYTPHSDLDLHILVDMSKMPNDEIYKELFNAKKSLYNDSHDIKIHGVPVELYVQDAREPVISLGEYSILNDKWLRIPTKRRANFDQTATKSKYEKLLNLIEIALKTKKYSKVQNIIKTIRRYRQAGLDNGGEFGPENLAYKALRSQGYITKLYDLKDKLHSELLTIENMYQPITDEDYDPNGPPPGPEFKPTMPKGTVRVDVSDVYDWYKLGQHISNMKGLGKHDFGKGPPSTIMSFGDEDLEHQYIKDLEKTGLATTDIDPVDPNQPKGMKRQKVDPTYNVNEAFDKPYKTKTEKSEYGDVDMLAKLPDGTNLSIMFNKQQNNEGEETIQVDFWRNNSQEVTGEGDAQRIFATALASIQKYIKKYKPARLSFSARKETDPTIYYGPDDVVPNPESRAKLYDHLVQRYAEAWGYRAFRADTGDLVIYELSRINKKVDPTYNVNEAVDDNYLYHATQPSGMMRILRSGSIKASYRPQEATKARTQSPTVSTTRSKQYAESDDFVNFLNLTKEGNSVIIVFDRNAVANHYKMFSTSQGTQTVGDEFEEVIVVPKGMMPIQSTMKGFYFNPKRTSEIEEFKDTPWFKELLNSPYYMRTKQGMAEDETMQYAAEKTSATNPYGGLKDIQYRGSMSEASGYIPSEKEKNNPLFSSALTVDVHPDSIKKNAKAFGWLTSRAGIPPTAKANGKI